MSAQAALLQAFAALKRAHAGAVVSVAVKVDANNTVTVEGLRGGVMAVRAVARGGLSNAIDTSALVPVAGFESPLTLCGKECTITDAAGMTISGRLLPVRLHALGGLMTLAIGEYDRVTQ